MQKKDDCPSRAEQWAQARLVIAASASLLTNVALSRNNHGVELTIQHVAASVYMTRRPDAGSNTKITAGHGLEVVSRDAVIDHTVQTGGQEAGWTAVDLVHPNNIFCELSAQGSL